jgi:hypothetical protein
MASCGSCRWWPSISHQNVASDLFFTTPGGTFKVVTADAHENRCKRLPFIHFLKENFNYFFCLVSNRVRRVLKALELDEMEGRQNSNFYL